jgi:hypothetical protein
MRGAVGEGPAKKVISTLWAYVIFFKGDVVWWNGFWVGR